MYNFSIRLIIALATFTLSVLITLNSHYQPIKIEPHTKVQTSQSFVVNKLMGFGYATGQSIKTVKQKVPLENKNKPVVCRDKTISLVWKQLINSQKDFWEWVNSTFEVYNCSEMFEVTKLDLNGDGIKEIKIRGKLGNFCGATGNCSEWIFGRIEKSTKYKLLLQSGGEYFYVKKHSTNNYRDIYITTHDSASSSYHMIYKFSSGKYQETKCWFEDYTYDGEKYVMNCDEKTKQSEEQLRESEAKLKESNN